MKLLMINKQLLEQIVDSLLEDIKINARNMARINTEYLAKTAERLEDDPFNDRIAIAGTPEERLRSGSIRLSPKNWLGKPAAKALKSIDKLETRSYTEPVVPTGKK